MDQLATRRFYEQAFGADHYYGYRTTVESIQDVQLADLKKHRDQLLTPKNGFGMISGKLSANSKNFLRNTLEAWNPSGSTQAKDKSTEAQDSKTLLIPKEGASQVALRIGRKCFNKTAPEYKKFILLNTAFGGYFGSRLMSNIREEKGYTYGIYSVVRNMLDGGLFYITSEVGVDVYEDSIKQINLEIDRLKNDLIPQEEIDLVRNYISGSLMGGIDGLFNVAGSIRSILEFDMDFDYLSDLFETAKTVSREELQSMAQQFFDKEQMFEVSVGVKG